MGQLISNLSQTLQNDHNQTNHFEPNQPFNPVDQHQRGLHIIIPDQSAFSITANVGNNDLKCDPLTRDNVVDLSNDGYEEDVSKKKRRRRKRKNQPNQGDRLSVTASSAFSSYSVSSVWKIGLYKSSQRILLVGEGDFSFSACLGIAFGNAVNITATSLNSEEFLYSNYGNFITNKTHLVTRGSMVLHDVDATKMLKHPVLGYMVFDRIVFNFPHAGRFGHTDDELRAHQKLIRGFVRNAKKMIEDDGEIHITSKSNGFYLGWDIPKIGSDHNLNLIQEVKFLRSNYPGYSTKYGFGGDRDFDCNPSKTYKFGLSLE